MYFNITFVESMWSSSELNGGTSLIGVNPRLLQHQNVPNDVRLFICITNIISLNNINAMLMNSVGWETGF